MKKLVMMLVVLLSVLGCNKTKVDNKLIGLGEITDVKMVETDGTVSFINLLVNRHNKDIWLKFEDQHILISIDEKELKKLVNGDVASVCIFNSYMLLEGRHSKRGSVAINKYNYSMEIRSIYEDIDLPKIVLKNSDCYDLDNMLKTKENNGAVVARTLFK